VTTLFPRWHPHLGRKATSIHGLNADKGFSNRLQAATYLLLNWVNNLFPYMNVDSGLVIRDFVCDELRERWDRLSVRTSPARRLSDLFWLELPWDEIGDGLGAIRILDTGCGSGVWGPVLVDYSDSRVISYTGLDINRHANWTKVQDRYRGFRFHQIMRGEDISSHIPEGTSFFMTQSAIEHFDEDLRFFQQIRDYVLLHETSVMQVHLFPASSCLRLYRFHGVRQYTPRTVSRIARLFSGFSHVTLFRLGGRECSRFHYERITKPILVDKSGQSPRDGEYERSLLAAVEQDMGRPQRSPVFYALVILSNWRQRPVWAS
jgi:hypothetical protein